MFSALHSGRFALKSSLPRSAPAPDWPGADGEIAAPGQRSCLGTNPLMVVARAGTELAVEHDQRGTLSTTHFGILRLCVRLSPPTSNRPLATDRVAGRMVWSFLVLVIAIPDGQQALWYFLDS
jgi:hypothetical protein